MRSTTEVEKRKGGDYVYVTCPECGECEGQPVDQQRHHLQSFTFVDHGDMAAGDDITEMECNTCDIPFSLTWDYSNVVYSNVVEEVSNDDDTNSISIVWCVDDIRHLGFQCTDKEGMSVLQSVWQEHDATMGVTWDTLDFWAHEHGLKWVDPSEEE